MKSLHLTFVFILVSFFASSFIAPEKTSAPEAFITFVGADGEERSERLSETSLRDWNDKVSLAEFRRGDQVVAVSGSVILSPKEGDALLLDFQNAESFTRIMQNLQSDFSIHLGDKIILDNLIIIETKKHFSPIVCIVK